MEPITHLAAGVLTAQALRRCLGNPRGLTPLCAVAATVPDLDILSGWVDPELYLLHHRGLTHSLFALPFLALLLAWLARRLGAAVPLRAGFCAAALALATHLFLDVVTAFGTQLLAPFSDVRTSLDGIYIIDPFFTAGLATLAFLARTGSGRTQQARFRLALLGLGLMVLYPALGTVLRLDMQRRYEALLVRRGQAYDRLAMTPDALAPYYWKVVVEKGPDMQVTTANPLDIAADYPVLTLKRADRAEMRRLGRQASIFGTLAEFAVFPFVEHAPAAEGARSARYGDASFLNSGPVLRAINGDATAFAEFTAFLDSAGRLTSWRDDRGRMHPVLPAGGF